MTTEHRGALAPVSVLPTPRSAPAGPVLAGLIPTGPGSVADLGGFKETLSPQAFAKADMSSTQLVVGHDHSGRFTLASVRGGTLELRPTPEGLRWRAQLPDSDLAQHYVALADSGALGVSFAFVVGRDTWSRDADGTLWRTIEAVAELADVSLAAVPAYGQASAWAEGSERGTVRPLRPARREIGTRIRHAPDGRIIRTPIYEGDPPLGAARPIRLQLARMRLELARRRIPPHAVVGR
jgi:HK97 family phage prohead protease